MIIEITYDEQSDRYSVRDGRTGTLILAPMHAPAALDRLAALGHAGAADRIREDVNARAADWPPESLIVPFVAEAEAGYTPDQLEERDPDRRRVIDAFERGENLFPNRYPSELARMNPENTAPTPDSRGVAGHEAERYRQGVDFSGGA